MSDAVTWLKERIQSVYDRNPFVKLLDMKIVDLRKGESMLAMPVKSDFTNLYQLAHGGALAAIADTSMGVCCASLGKRVLTLDLNINYIHGAKINEIVQANGKIIHNGKSTIVAESELKDEAGNLVAKARGTFFVIGEFNFQK